MSAQDKAEQIIREMLVLLSKSKACDEDKNLIIVNKKEVVGLLNSLNESIYGIMDEYSLTKQGMDQNEREMKKRGEAIIEDATKKAEDVYAASVIYTDEALRRVQQLMDEASASVEGLYRNFEAQLQKEKSEIRSNQLDLKAYLQDLRDTDEYLSIIEDCNKKMAKGKISDQVEDTPTYAAVKPEIRINEEYFREHGLSLEEEEQPEEITEAVKPEITVNLDSEYFKWKEQEESGNKGASADKKTEKKSIFGKWNKGE